MKKIISNNVPIITGESVFGTNGVSLTSKLLRLNGGIKFWDCIASIQDELYETIDRTGVNIHGRYI